MKKSVKELLDVLLKFSKDFRRDLEGSLRDIAGNS